MRPQNLILLGFVGASCWIYYTLRNRKTKRLPSKPTTTVENHEKSDVLSLLNQLRVLRKQIQFRRTAKGERCSDSAPIENGKKKIHFIRHGEGFHNVAQREWRQQQKKGEPYTMDNDPNWEYVDAVLTPVGVQQANDLKTRVKDITPQLMVVSPLRRATQTGLIAFDGHVKRKALNVVALELCHETGGKHTCDKRLDRTELANQFPDVDYSLITDESDPLWCGRRETAEECAIRCGRFLEWLAKQKEDHIVVAAHSSFLLTLFNTALFVENEADSSWFGTGEMRTMMVSF